jgi:hypothetical protein
LSTEEQAKDLAEAATEATVAAAGAVVAAKGVAALAVAGVAASAVGVALLPSAAALVVGRAFAAHSRKLDRKVRRWFEEVGAIMELGGAEAAAESINRHIEEPWAHEAVVRATRAIIEDMDEAALPFLARITAHALKIQAVPDGRSRRATALLAEIRAPTLEAALSVVRGLAPNWPDYVPAAELILRYEVGPGEHEAFEASDPTRSEKLGATLAPPSGKPVLARLPATKEWYTVLELLKQHLFAAHGIGGVLGSTSGPHVAVFRREDFEFLAWLFR